MLDRLKKGIAAAAVVAAGVLAGGAIAHAGVYTSATNCNHATAGNRICFDISANEVVIVAPDGAQTGYAAGWSSPTPAPTAGFIAFDAECNAAAGGNTTSFSTGGAYGLPTSIRFVEDGAGPPAIGNIYVSAAAANVIAWLANSGTGYECFIVR